MEMVRLVRSPDVSSGMPRHNRQALQALLDGGAICCENGSGELPLHLMAEFGPGGLPPWKGRVNCFGGCFGEMMS